MKAIDHSECNPYDCIHAKELQTQKEADDKEMAYYHAKRQAKVAADAPERRFSMEAAQNTVAFDTTGQTAEWRARKVQLLEDELLEARMEQVNHGDPMPLQELRNVVGDALRLAHEKNRVYGDAWRKNGYMGNLARIKSKTDRLDNLLWRDPDGNGYPLPDNYTRDGETVVDTLLDLINMCGFMAVNFTEGNRWG